MTTGTGRNTGAAELASMGACAGELPVLAAANAPCESGSGGQSMPSFIEVSDKDYRSFCFPCYAMEESTDCNAGQ